MRVKVLYFGVLRDMCGVSDEMAELADGATVGELLRILRAKASNQAMSDSVESGADSGTDSDSDSKAGLLRGGRYCAYGEKLATLAKAAAVRV